MSWRDFSWRLAGVKRFLCKDECQSRNPQGGHYRFGILVRTYLNATALGILIQSSGTLQVTERSLSVTLPPEVAVQRQTFSVSFHENPEHRVSWGIALVRCLYFKALGFEVVNAQDAHDACRALHSRFDCDLAILCYTLSEADKLAVEAYLRISRPTVRLVELHLADLPVTSGIAVDAFTQFHTLLMSWAESRPGDKSEQLDGNETAPLQPQLVPDPKL